MNVFASENDELAQPLVSGQALECGDSVESFTSRVKELACFEPMIVNE